MKLNLGSLAFGFFIESGGGTPAWGTELGQSRPEYKFTIDGYEEVLIGMLYNSVNLKYISLPLGKGGRMDKASNYDECILGSLFNEVFINGIKIGYPFIMVLIREQSQSHNGRHTIKYSDKITYNYNNHFVSNSGFFKEAREKLGLSPEACWFIYSMNVTNQDQLHFKAVIVNKDYSEYYTTSAEKKEHWLSLIPK